MSQLTLLLMVVLAVSAMAIVARLPFNADGVMVVVTMETTSILVSRCVHRYRAGPSDIP